MSTTIDTTDQFAGDGNAKGLPIGLKDVDTTGKSMPIISAVVPAQVAGAMYFTPGTGVLSISNGTKFLNTTLTQVQFYKHKMFVVNAAKIFLAREIGWIVLKMYWRKVLVEFFLV